MSRNSTKVKLRCLGAVALLCLAGQLLAEPLTFDFTASSSRADAELTFSIQNQSGRTLQDIQIIASRGAGISCATGGSAVSQQRLDQLENNQRIECNWTPSDGFRQSSVVLTSHDAQGRPLVQRLLMTAVRGVVTVDQGIVVLISSAVHNDDNFNGLLEVGESIDYNYRLINLGTLALQNLAVTDLDGGVTCPATMLAVGADLDCDRTYVITIADESVGRVDNQVEVSGQDTNGLPVQSSDLISRLNLAGRAAIAVIKSPFLLDDVDGSGFASLGDRVRYDFVVRNTSDQTLSNVELIEPNPDLIDTPIVCAAQTLDGNPFAGNGTGVLEPGDIVICSAEYDIRQRDVDAGQALNLVEASAQTPLDLTVQATGASALVVPGGQLSVEKTTADTVVDPSGTAQFEITVSNVGTIPLFDVVIDDPIPAGIVSFDWTCSGAFCPNASGSGAINETVVTLPVGETLVYSIQAEVDILSSQEIINIVSVQPPGVVVCQPDLNLPPCQDDASVRILEPIAVPVMSQWALVVLMLLMLSMVFRSSAYRAD